MLEKEFENILKENLEHSRIEWDKEAFWVDLEEALPSSKKKPYVFFFFLCTGALMLLSTVYYLNFASPKTAELAEGVQHQEKHNISAENEPLNDLAKTFEDQRVNEFESVSSSAKDTPASRSNSEQSLISTIAPSDQALIQYDNKNAESQIEQIQSTNNQSVVVPEVNPIIIKKQNPIQSQLVQSLQNNVPTVIVKQFAINERLRSAPTISISLSKETIEPNKLTKKVSNSLIAYGHVGYNRFTSNYPQVSRDGLESSIQESAIENYGTGLQYQLNLSNRIWIRPGIEYSKLTARFFGEVQHLETQSVEVDSAFTYNTFAGNQIVISGQREITTGSESVLEYYNSYQSISIPIDFGYELPFKQWSVTVYGGVAISLFEVMTGKYLDDTMMVRDAKKNKTSNSVSLNSIRVGLESNALLSKNIDLIYGVQYNKGLNNINELSLQNRAVDSYRIKLGLRHYL